VPLPPLFEDRNDVEQIVGGTVVPILFGLVTGLALGWNEIVYYVLVGPIAIAGGLYAGLEHRGPDEGLARGLVGGLVFGSFILLGHEIANNEPEVTLPDPQAGLVFVTTVAGGVLGALGGAYRVRRERRLGPTAASRPG
jgi:hypothetical protein